MISRVADSSQIGGARRAAAALARQAGLDEDGAGRIALVATEMATNLFKHARSGDIAMQRIADGDGDCIELLALDAGPGMADIARALRDGHSTAGSGGTGLGAIRRQSDRFAIWSWPGVGTAVMARFVLNRPATGPAMPTLGVMLAPFPGETVCGDAWAFASAPGGASVLLADGLGHGPLAAKAAGAAVACFAGNQGFECARIAEAIHAALKPTRGAAIGIARIDAAHRLVRFVGIGNIVAAVASDGICKRMVSHNGTAGHIASRINEFTYPYGGAPCVILHSDGLSAKWDLASYPGLAAGHPSLIAGVLFSRMRRERDDACIVAMRVPQ